MSCSRASLTFSDDYMDAAHVVRRKSTRTISGTRVA